MNLEMPKKPAAPAPREETRGRKRVYKEPRQVTTLRLIPDHHEFLRDYSHLKALSMTVVLEHAIDEYRRNHQHELLELNAKKGEQLAAHKLKPLPAAPPRVARRA
jgi:hypothetical protein